MQYVLGNMLGAAGPLNPDRLSLDLQFAADKTLTARQGPTPTFTRASTATFVGSDGLIQSAAINEARFDHDPVTLESKGLLIEESRTNAIIQSDTLATQTITVTAAARTLSFYGTGTVVLSGAHIATVTGTGAYPTRTTLTFTPSAGSLILTVTGSVTQAQLEAGEFPTSYIPTTTAPLTRNADVCDITGSDFTGFYNQSEGSFACNYSIPAGFTGNRYAASIEDTVGGTQNGFVFRNTNSAISFIAGGGYSSTIGAVTTTASKHILAYSGLTEFVYVKDSVVGTTTGSGTRDPSLPIKMSIGTLEGANAFSICGHIAAIRYFKKRLANAKLQTLTS
jgi:energy-converting hydrogenase Eha subunit B